MVTNRGYTRRVDPARRESRIRAAHAATLRPMSMAISEDVPEDSATDARLSEMLDLYGQLLRRAIVHLCPRHLGLDFDDLEQEARVRLWRALRRETEIEHPASYLFRLASSVTIDAMRRATARRERFLESLTIPAVVNEVPSIDAGEIAERRLELRRVQEHLATLPADRRRAVGLHLQGFTPSEIAQLAGWTEPKSRSLVYRGLRELRERLGKEVP
jgi:RNA polymerase sigma factor (sigma-70 family)